MFTTPKIKKAAGGFIYASDGTIFIMTSNKWGEKSQRGQIWTIPGGKFDTKDGKEETPEEALKREVGEELQIELEKIEPIREITRLPAPDFKDPNLAFHFYDFIARAKSKLVKPNTEINNWQWIPLGELQQKISTGEIILNDSAKNLLEECAAQLAKRITELRQEQKLVKK